MKFEHYYDHPNRPKSKGHYTDDCQLSIAIAEASISGRPYTKEKFAKSFFDTYKRDRRGGYARNFQKLLEEVKTWEELLERLRPDSDKNGAAMRSVPIGVLSGVSEVLSVAETQAKITHDTVGGITSSQIVALASHYSIYLDEPLEKEPLLAWLKQYVIIPDEFYTDFDGPVVGPGVGMVTARAVIDLITRNTNLLDVMRHAIIMTGDLDSVLSIALGIASNRMDRSKLPDFLIYELEPGRKYGVEFLKNLGKDLFEKVY